MRGEIIRTTSGPITKWICDSEDEFAKQIEAFSEHSKLIELNSSVKGDIKFDDVHNVIVYGVYAEPKWVTLYSPGKPALIRLNEFVLYSLGQTEFKSLIVDRDVTYM